MMKSMLHTSDALHMKLHCDRREHEPANLQILELACRLKELRKRRELRQGALLQMACATGSYVGGQTSSLALVKHRMQDKAP